MLIFGLIMNRKYQMHALVLQGEVAHIYIYIERERERERERNKNVLLLGDGGIRTHADFDYCV